MSQAPGSAAAPQTAEARGWPGWYVWLLLGVAVSGLALGAASGTVALLLRPAPELEEPLTPASIPASEEAKDLVARADEKLLEREYAAALAQYRSSLGPEPSPLVQFRIATCLEGLGKWAEAQQVYAELAERWPNTALAYACQVGLARLEYRQGRLPAACQRLAQALLTAGDRVVPTPSVVGTARLQYVAWTILRHHPYDWPGSLEPGIIVAPWPLEPPENAWLWLSKLGEQALRPWPVASEAWRIQPAHSPEECLVSVQIPRRSVAEVLQRLAQQAGLTVTFSPAAQASVGDRQVHDVQLDSWPLGEVITLLADVGECVWYRQGNRVYLTTVGELKEQSRAGEGQPPQEQARATLLRAAVAVLNRLLLLNSESPLPSAHRLFWLKGLCHQQLGERSEARTWWQRLLARWPQQAESYYASFNLGVMSWQEGDLPTAKQMWMRAADQAPDHRFTPLAYLYAGRAELAQLRVEGALPLLRRAVHTASAQDVRPAALLLLSASYLYLENAAAAHQLLVDHRRWFQVEPYRSCAAFLDALARSQLRPGRLARRESEDLLTALLHVPDWRLLEPLGPLLAGRAWMRLQLPEQALRIYRVVLPRARSVWRKELLLAYGESCLALGLHEELRQAARELLESADGAWRPAAHWLLARSALQQGDYHQAIEHAQQALMQPGKIPRESVLRLMGEAYSALGDAHRAAECYAGRFPES